LYYLGAMSSGAPPSEPLPPETVRRSRNSSTLVSGAKKEVPIVSLRTIHLIFILIVIMTAEMFGARELFQFRQTGEFGSLWLGILSLLGGLALCVYAFYFVRKMDSADIH
jgi:hypothetical protein